MNVVPRPSRAPIALAGVLLAVSPVSAEEAPAPTGPERDDESYLEWLAQREGTSEAPGSAVHVDIAVDWVSAYFFRGILQERHDLIIQNSIEVGFDILDPAGDGDHAEGTSSPLGLTGLFGLWNSFHEAATGAMTDDDFTEHWYEADLYLGLTGVYDNWSFGAIYYANTSPSDAFSTCEEVVLTVSYDDSDWWTDDISLSPSATLALETQGGADGGDTGTYLGLGITPAVKVELLARSIALSFPVIVGVSLDDYYQDENGRDDTFGYVDLGAEFAVDLPVDARYGSWALSGGIHWLVLGDNTQDANLGRGNQFYGRLGIEISF